MLRCSFDLALSKEAAASDVRDAFEPCQLLTDGVYFFPFAQRLEKITLCDTSPLIDSSHHAPASLSFAFVFCFVF